MCVHARVRGVLCVDIAQVYVNNFLKYCIETSTIIKWSYAIMSLFFSRLALPARILQFSCDAIVAIEIMISRSIFHASTKVVSDNCIILFRSKK